MGLRFVSRSLCNLKRYGFAVASKSVSASTPAQVYNRSSYSVTAAYDNHGNIVYTRDPEGAEHFYSYANTNSQNQFVDSKGEPVNLFSNQFYINNVPTNCHTLPVGEAFINIGKVQEIYYKYDAKGNLMETKTLFPTRNYRVFSGTFNEPSQTIFEFDLTGLTITDGILVISSIAVPYPETLCETHSEVGTGWLNTGTWQGKYFLANYHRCHHFDCYDGQTKIGPFEHYPGSPNYTGYTTWIEDRTQYVKASYSAIVNEYPEKVDYKLNSGSWIVITNDLGSGTTSITVPASSFVQGVNTLQFQESNTYSTKFEWTLYIDRGAVPEEYHTQFTHDNYGNLTSVTDALGNTTLLGYDSHHMYLASVTNALNHTLAVHYDFNTGLLTSMTDPKGNTTSFEYDILRRVTKKILPDLSELEAVYNDQNNCVTIYDQLDHYTNRYYDGLNRLTRTELYLSPAEKLTETYAYNYLNKVKMCTDFDGHVYSYEYDSLGRLERMVNPDFTFMQAQYDDTTNTVLILDENQHKKEYHYDWVQNLVWVKEYTDPQDYYLTQYCYDSLGNLTSFTDANGNTTFYDYDSIHGVTQITYPDSTTEVFSYDAAGHLVQKTDSNGTTEFIYNSVYQLTGILYPDQSFVSHEYDINGNRILMTDSEGTTLYLYDNRNRLTSETRTIGGNAYTVNYEYDSASRLISLTYPDESIVTNQYDGLNRLISVPGYAEFTYTNSLLESVTYSNGVETTYQYDNRDRPVSIQAYKDDTDLLLMNYQYDPVGNITQLSYGRRLPDQTWVQSLEAFEYDWLDRLVTSQGENSSSYLYDPVGNRLAMNGFHYTYNSMNELLSVSDGTVYTYDGSGNVVSKNDGVNTWSYIYDRRNKLIQIEKNQQIIAEYSYDGDGKRIEKTEWIESLQEYQTTIYVYSGSNVIYEKNLTTNREATYIYGPAGRIAKNASGLRDYYHTDHLGSVRLITAESGSVVTATDYRPFGKDVLTGKKDPFTYTGKEKDSSGLYYYGARYYDCETGRFTTRDFRIGQLINPQTLNRYTYVLNNPLKYRDPDGNEQAGALVGNSSYPGLSGLGAPVVWSWAPQKIGTMSPGDPTCLLAMFALCAIPFLPFATPLAEAIASFGSEAVSLASSVLGGVLDALSKFLASPKGMDLMRYLAGIYTVPALTLEIQTIRNILDLLEHLGGFWKLVRGFVVTVNILDNLTIVVVVTFLNAQGEPICGSVAFSNGDRYIWKLEDGVYYVFIDGEWVPITDPDWKPGDPLP